MKKISIFRLAIVGAYLLSGIVLTVNGVTAQELLKYACSNQVFNAFEMDNLKEFTKTTGIEMDVHTASSGSCVYRLMNGYCDIASTARELYRRHQEYGYTQIPFAKDPLAIIAHKRCGVENLASEQLQDIFSGDITNWKELGGADLPITIIVPAEDTAANKNFRRQVMKHKEIKHDFMAYDSTMVIEAVKHFPCSTISFISQGAALHHEEIITIKIDGYYPTDKDYPYYQIFYYIIRGEPAGDVKKFIDFTFSEQGAEILKRNGTLPIARK
ncbi:MAG: substrate-binding domain-containing protein [Deltaproteobacteria bacterium]|nr:MAG: substrate-binding domain-containing protein [Deltaproteobacteria bacterium]